MTRYRDGGQRYATSGRIWLVNQRRIVRNEPPHSPEFNARTWTLDVCARGLLNMRETEEKEIAATGGGGGREKFGLLFSAS